MTIQMSDVISWNGAEYAMEQCPLESWFLLVGKGPRLAPGSTALKRGYLARWGIRNDRLYLDRVSGSLLCGEPLSIRHFFPDATGPVFFHWYGGELKLPHGDARSTPYGDVWERFWILKLRKGLVIEVLDQANAELRIDE